MGLLGVSGLEPDEKGWCFAVHRSTVDAMRGKPASDKSLRKESGQTMGMQYPALRRQRVLLREQSAAWEVAGNFSGGG